MPSVDVREDPDLGPGEKEVTINWTKGADTLTVFADLPSVARWLMRNGDADIVDRTTKEGAVTSVKARLPVGALQLSGHPRKSSQPSDVTGSLPES